eukprot:UN11029
MNNEFLTDFFKSPWGADFQFPLRNLYINKIPGEGGLHVIGQFFRENSGGADFYAALTGDFEYLRNFPCTGDFEFLRVSPVLETLSFSLCYVSRKNKAFFCKL